MLVILAIIHPVRAAIFKGKTTFYLQTRIPICTNMKWQLYLEAGHRHSYNYIFLNFNALKGQLYIKAGQCPAKNRNMILTSPEGA